MFKKGCENTQADALLRLPSNGTNEYIVDDEILSFIAEGLYAESPERLYAHISDKEGDNVLEEDYGVCFELLALEVERHSIHPSSGYHYRAAHLRARCQKNLSRYFELILFWKKYVVYDRSTGFLGNFIPHCVRKKSSGNIAIAQKTSTRIESSC